MFISAYKLVNNLSYSDINELLISISERFIDNSIKNQIKKIAAEACWLYIKSLPEPSKKELEIVKNYIDNRAGNELDQIYESYKKRTGINLSSDQFYQLGYYYLNLEKL